MAHTHLCLLYHIVFSTHDRRPHIQPDIQPRLVRYMAGILKNLDGKAILINGTPDHVHLLCHLRAAHSLAEVLQKVKANSSRWVHKEHGNQEFQWQEGYGAFTVSVSQQQRVYDYIANQTEHHRKMTFQEELVALLEKHGVEYDERFLCG